MPYGHKCIAEKKHGLMIFVCEEKVLWQLQEVTMWSQCGHYMCQFLTKREIGLS